MRKLIITTIGMAMLFLNACAGPTYVNMGPEPQYYPTEVIPITVGVSVDDSHAGCVDDGSHKCRSYGVMVVEHLKSMRVFKNIVFPYGKADAVDAVLSLSIQGKWEVHNKGRAVANFLVGTPNFNDVEGHHEVYVTLRIGNPEVNYRISVNTKGQCSGTDSNLLASQFNTRQTKKIAIALANRFNEDRARILEIYSKWRKG